MRITHLIIVAIGALVAITVWAADSPVEKIKEKVRQRMESEAAKKQEAKEAESEETEEKEPTVVQVDTNNPIKLQSVEALKHTNAPSKKTAAPRMPVYVLPEVIEVRVPGGFRFVFVEQHHLQELVKKFPAIRYTNVIIYADGL